MSPDFGSVVFMTCDRLSFVDFSLDVLLLLLLLEDVFVDFLSSFAFARASTSFAFANCLDTSSSMASLFESLMEEIPLPWL